jgi:hypothetical protein
VALTTAQVQSLTSDQISQGLTTTQVKALETRDVAALKTSQVSILTTDQIVALTTYQIMALSTNQVFSLTTDQKGVLSTAQTQALTVASPLVLDLNGDGITTQSVNNGVKFDIFGIDQKVQTGWVAGGDGLLVMDRNHDGSINGGAELFGEGTTLTSGRKAANGYLALSELDSNADGIISASDAAFSELMVWVDANSDGVSASPELRTLSSLGITQLDLKAQSSTAVDNGNIVGLVSSFTTADGDQHQMADVWFSTQVAPGSATSLDAQQAAVPALDLAAPEKAQPAPGLVSAHVPTVVEGDLKAQVLSLVDALQAYNSTGMPPTKTLEGPSATLQPKADASTLGAGVVGMADVLKQFDVNGRPVNAVVEAPSVSAPVMLNTAGKRKPDADMLATGGSPLV